jgi:transcriptional regulator with XRE-family HTH domain
VAVSDDRPLEALDFGPALARLMQARGLSYRQLAARTDLSGGYLNHLVHGSRPVPANDVIERVAVALDVDAATFRDYRLRVVWEAIRDRPEVIERLYAELVRTQP